ncbi:MAG: FliH/SctL family protein [Syntrophobacteraceae bacterium]
MSNLLKKKADRGIPAYGFPVLDGPEISWQKKPDAEIEETLFSEPEPDPAEMYRKKLLELERRTQDIEKEAYAKGFAQGEKDGLEYGHKSIQVIKAQLERTIDALDTLPEQIFRDYRTWFITNCVRIAKRVVRKELAISPDIIATTLNGLLDEAEEHSSLTVYLHPLDIEFIEKRAHLILNGKSKRFSFKADSGLERGGCRIESDVQLLDASIDSQFEVLEKYLLAELQTEETTGGSDEF